ncbi:amidase [Agrobacterium rosae]|uniref:Amidase n=1 Tax=Agrobacterium rosae TaxID=1972867 RepID=A0AAW9FSQ8_9HYPH|nr:amidase [Agrobacterium rosae]MDX8305823.1 amidase [Agrobacterium rosae]
MIPSHFPDNIWQQDATDILAGYAAQTFTPREVVEALLQRISVKDEGLNSVVALSPSAISEAERSTQRWRSGNALGRLEGIPILVKDNLEVAGMPATFGSKLFASNIPARDELPIARLRAAGAIIIGKTNCPEFALEGYTANELHGVTGNPFDLSKTSGGSSGGAVSAVAMGFAPIAIGTDGGGSLRRPAAYTGIIGLKPTTGTVARSEALPQLLLDFEVVGPFARSVRDIELCLGVLKGAARKDPNSRYRPANTSMRNADKPLRILYAETIGAAPVDPAIRTACAAAANEFRNLGHRVTLGELPFDIGPLNTLWPLIGQTALASLRQTQPDFDALAAEKYRKIADLGETVKAQQLFDLLNLFTALRRKASVAFGKWDLILTPCCAAMPWPAEDAFPEQIDGQAVGPRGHAVHTAWVNACHLPAMSLPSPLHNDQRIPIGIQLIADLGHEHVLLDVAKAYERRVSFRKWPDLAF